MNNINNCVLDGNLTRDAQLTYTTGGTAICKISIANNRYQGKDKESYVSYFDLTIWGKMAESLSQYLLKGKGITAICEARQNRWSDDAGNARSKIEFTVRELEFKGGGSSDNTGKTEATKSEPAVDPGQFDDDGIPF